MTVFGRLAHANETGLTLRLSTGFGGGKTHTLMTLWHLGKNAGSPLIGADVLASNGRPASVTTIAVDCGKAGIPDFNSYADASPKSLWGELFYLLGEATSPNGGGAKALATLGAADHPEASPNAKQVEAVLPAGPILFLRKAAIARPRSRLSSRAGARDCRLPWRISSKARPAM